jgi:hypothetical protein
MDRMSNIMDKAKEDGKIGVYLIDYDGNLVGTVDPSAWENAKWYQKLWGFFNKKYKERFVSLKPIPVDND